MPFFEISIKNVKATDNEQAEKVAEGFQTIANTLSPQEVIELAALLKEKPGIVQKAKQYLNIF